MAELGTRPPAADPGGLGLFGGRGASGAPEWGSAFPGTGPGHAMPRLWPRTNVEGGHKDKQTQKNLVQEGRGGQPRHTGPSVLFSPFRPSLDPGEVKIGVQGPPGRWESW